MQKIRVYWCSSVVKKTMLKRWKIEIEYDGTAYHGWQRQESGLPTIQQSIEAAIHKFCAQDITITAAGRTDAGVHAHGQVAHFDLDYGDRALDGFNLAKAINAHLRPEPIAIVNAKEVDSQFHARFGATNKLYRYRIITRPAPPIHDLAHVWYLKHAIDIELMREGAKHLIGRHDFTSFRDSQCQAKTPIRTLDRISIETVTYDSFDGHHIQIELEAQSFLHHQCRNIVGTLTDVGRGKTKPAGIKDILAGKDRTQAGITAPASGLSLVRIDY
jgi:tRNA pseudouridine38-40 synthase